jgi:hypothetical protein
LHPDTEAHGEIPARNRASEDHLFIIGGAIKKVGNSGGDFTA